MTIARKEVVTGGEGVYHCTSRCVRRAYLCGYDKALRRSFNHRKEWVRTRIKFLVEIFCIEVLAYALMSNHQHTLLRIAPAVLRMLTDEEIATRWLRLYPTETSRGSGFAAAVSALAQNKKRIAVLRERLGSISWFMKSFSEHIARRANREDDCKGRFWEGRFRCQRICDEAALLACSMYIDLNPIRANIAKTPEESKYTSVWERIGSLRGVKASQSEPPLWIAPIEKSKNARGYLSMSLPEYFALLDATGRELRYGKRGIIPSEYEPILTRLGIHSAHWIELTTKYGRWFSSFAGSRSSLEKAATKARKSWYKGIRPAARVFL